MTLTIDFAPQQEAALLATAKEYGIDPAELVKKWALDHLRSPEGLSAANDPTLALFAEWEKEDATMTPEEIDEENALWNRFESGINATRNELGMEPL